MGTAESGNGRLISMPKYQTASFYSFFLLIFLVACSDKEENFQVIKQSQGIVMQSSLSEQDFSNLGNRFVDWVEECQEEDNIPGVAIALVSSQGKERVLTQGFGYRDLENQLPVTPETLL
ncbi:MAG: beta-lactamase family protein, partial [Symploca sp. SIO2D2]|nr:beta-lactamase family protein [Symploca sp. SIO2D2]